MKKTICIVVVIGMIIVSTCFIIFKFVNKNNINYRSYDAGELLNALTDEFDYVKVFRCDKHKRENEPYNIMLILDADFNKEGEPLENVIVFVNDYFKNNDFNLKGEKVNILFYRTSKEWIATFKNYNDELLNSFCIADIGSVDISNLKFLKSAKFINCECRHYNNTEKTPKRFEDLELPSGLEYISFSFDERIDVLKIGEILKNKYPLAKISTNEYEYMICITFNNGNNSRIFDSKYR